MSEGPGRWHRHALSVRRFARPPRGTGASRVGRSPRRGHSRRARPTAMAATIGPMILERSMNDQFLSNTYLVADEDGGTAVMIDAGGPVGPLLEAIDARDLTLTHVLLTHHHYDHVSELGQVTERHPDA